MYTCYCGNCSHHWSHPPLQVHHTSHQLADHSMALTPPVDKDAVKLNECDLVKNWQYLKNTKYTQVDNTRHWFSNQSIRYIMSLQECGQFHVR